MSFLLTDVFSWKVLALVIGLSSLKYETCCFIYLLHISSISLICIFFFSTLKNSVQNKSWHISFIHFVWKLFLFIVQLYNPITENSKKIWRISKSPPNRSSSFVLFLSPSCSLQKIWFSISFFSLLPHYQFWWVSIWHAIPIVSRITTMHRRWTHPFSMGFLGTQEHAISESPLLTMAKSVWVPY